MLTDVDRENIGIVTDQNSMTNTFYCFWNYTLDPVYKEFYSQFNTMGEDPEIVIPLMPPEMRYHADFFTAWLMDQYHSFPNVDQSVRNNDFFLVVGSDAEHPLSVLNRRLAIPTRKVILKIGSNINTLVPSCLYAGFTISENLNPDWLHTNGFATVLPLFNSLSRYPSYGPSQIGDPQNIEHIMQRIVQIIEAEEAIPDTPPNVLNFREITIFNGVKQVRRTLETSPATPEIQIVVGRLYPHDLGQYKELIRANNLPLTSIKDLTH